MSPFSVIACILVVLGAVSSSPVPSGWGKHEHHIIHVPYHVHHVHHVHKYPVYIKSKPIIIKEHHDPHSDWSPASSGWSSSGSGWDWDKCKYSCGYFVVKVNVTCICHISYLQHLAI